MDDPYNWRGNSMDEIYRGMNPFELQAMPPIQCSNTHKVLFEFPITGNPSEPPTQRFGKAKWDYDHVRLPCAEQSTIIIDGKETKRWEVIETALLQPISSIAEFEAAILKYNPKYVNRWKFNALHDIFGQLPNDEDYSNQFFKEILPGIIRLALQLPTLVPNAIPLLKRGRSGSISMTQQQVACLLANAFLCTFPRRNSNSLNQEYGLYPHINFASLYVRCGYYAAQEKIKCIINYFRRVCDKMPTGVITFHRRSKCTSDFPDWSTCQQTFNPSMKMHATCVGTIEDGGNGLLQMDFANKYLGGGVLGHGCVQEEIRFVICPELLCSMLFSERMDANEAFFIMGCERFSSYTGYAGSFKYAGDYNDETQRDQFRRRICTIVALDATLFRNKSYQYDENALKREANKAFVGFYHNLHTPAPAVATGNWGCGAFNGDRKLKSLLQLIVCCVTNRPMVYFAYGDTALCDDIEEMLKFLTTNRIKIADLWCWLLQFKRHELEPEQLYAYIFQRYQDAKQPLLLAKQGPSKKLSSELSAAILVNKGPIQNNDNPEEKIEDFDSSDDSNNNGDGEEEQPKKANGSVNLVTKSTSPEKRPYRSMIECLEDSYNENPPKVKRATEPLAIEKSTPLRKCGEQITKSESCSGQKIIESQAEDGTALKEANKSLQIVGDTKSDQGTQKEHKSNISKGYTKNYAGEEDETAKVAETCSEIDMKQESSPKSSPVAPRGQGQKKIADYFKVTPTQVLPIGVGESTPPLRELIAGEKEETATIAGKYSEDDMNRGCPSRSSPVTPKGQCQQETSKPAKLRPSEVGGKTPPWLAKVIRDYHPQRETENSSPTEDE